MPILTGDVELRGVVSGRRSEVSGMLILVTGGSGSGKSAYAEDRILALGEGRRCYLAAMQPFDEESRQRIARHRRMRAGKGFETIERYTDLKGLRLAQETDRRPVNVLLECLSNLTANEIFSPEGSGEDAFAAIQSGIDSLLKQCDNLVVVTNEIFSDGVRYDPETVGYLRTLGRLNCALAKRADEVVEVVFGLPQCIKSVNRQ